MRRCLVCIVVALLAAGCFPDRQFAYTVTAVWEPISEEYVHYVREDPDLKEDSKADRLRSAALLTDYLNEVLK